MLRTLISQFGTLDPIRPCTPLARGGLVNSIQESSSRTSRAIAVGGGQQPCYFVDLSWTGCREEDIGHLLVYLCRFRAN